MRLAVAQTPASGAFAPPAKAAIPEGGRAAGTDYPRSTAQRLPVAASGPSAIRTRPRSRVPSEWRVTRPESVNAGRPGTTYSGTGVRVCRFQAHFPRRGQAHCRNISSRELIQRPSQAIACPCHQNVNDTRSSSWFRTVPAFMNHARESAAHRVCRSMGPNLSAL